MNPTRFIGYAIIILTGGVMMGLSAIAEAIMHYRLPYYSFVTLNFGIALIIFGLISLLFESANINLWGRIFKGLCTALSDEKESKSE